MKDINKIPKAKVDLTPDDFIHLLRQSSLDIPENCSIEETFRINEHNHKLLKASIFFNEIKEAGYDGMTIQDFIDTARKDKNKQTARNVLLTGGLATVTTAFFPGALPFAATYFAGTSLLSAFNLKLKTKGINMLEQLTEKEFPEDFNDFHSDDLKSIRFAVMNTMSKLSQNKDKQYGKERKTFNHGK